MPKNLRTTVIILGVSTGIGWLFFTYLTYSETGYLPDYGNHSLLLTVLLAASLTGAGIYGSIRLLDRRLAWQTSVTLRLITGLLTNCLLALLIPLACFLLYAQIHLSFSSIPALVTEYADLILKWIILTGFAGFGFTLTHFTLYSYHQYAVQLSPHYLFNCLNTISSLAYRDAHHAAEFIRKMAHTYQYLLATNDRSLVSLREELEFARAYSFLLKVRFEDSVEVTENVPAHLLDRKVPPLTIQMLLENAVKHNAVSADTPLLICISADEGPSLRISNKQQKILAGPSQSLKVGLENIRKRYRYFTNKEIEIIQDEHFTVRLPLILT
jgi:two-component system, LytTR family, sensor kinase